MRSPGWTSWPSDRLSEGADYPMNTQQEILASRNVNDLEIEPEGCDIRGRWLYVAFHTQKHPRKGKIYRFKIQ